MTENRAQEDRRAGSAQVKQIRQRPDEKGVLMKSLKQARKELSAAREHAVAQMFLASRHADMEHRPKFAQRHADAMRRMSRASIQPAYVDDDLPPERLGFYFSNHATMKYNSTQYLDIIMSHSQYTNCRFAHNSKGFGQNIICRRSIF